MIKETSPFESCVDARVLLPRAGGFFAGQILWD